MFLTCFSLLGTSFAEIIKSHSCDIRQHRWTQIRLQYDILIYKNIYLQPILKHLNVILNLF